jgi:very-short-patch-repair endonuclease
VYGYNYGKHHILITHENCMGILGKPEGIFDLENSDTSVGSYISIEDVCSILNVGTDSLSNLKFQKLNDITVIDERALQRAFYDDKVKGVIRDPKESLDERILKKIISKTLPDCQIERQIKVGRFSMDLKLTLEDESLFVEFDGPAHFARGRYGVPNHHPFRKKRIIEEKTGLEVVNWPYWIQRCESNVRTLFDKKSKGFGVLWSTNVHFGDFVFEDSAAIIKEMTSRFNAFETDGIGYFYGPNSKGRNNIEHPIINRIDNGDSPIEKILPMGRKEREFWLPDRLKNK